MNFIGLVHKDKGSDYGVSFPDFPGVITAGRNLDEARSMAEEALALHVEGMLEDGEPIPEPSSLEAVMAKRTNRNAAVIVVGVVTEGVARRVNVTLPEDVLARIDHYAGEHGLSRSGFLVKAAKQVLENKQILREHRHRVTPAEIARLEALRAKFTPAERSRLDALIKGVRKDPDDPPSTKKLGSIVRSRGRKKQNPERRKA